MAYAAAKGRYYFQSCVPRCRFCRRKAAEIEHFTKSPLFAYCAFRIAIISMFSEIPLPICIAISAIAIILVVFRSLPRSIREGIEKGVGHELGAILGGAMIPVVVLFPLVVAEMTQRWITGLSISECGNDSPVIRWILTMLEWGTVPAFWLTVGWIYFFLSRAPRDTCLVTERRDRGHLIQGLPRTFAG
jgi:hypothetical protein